MSTKELKKFDQAVQKWLDEDSSWVRQKTDKLNAFKAQKLGISPTTAITGIGKPALLSSAPLVASFGYDLVTAAVGLSVAGLLFVGHGALSGLESWSNRATGQVDEIEGEISVRIGDLLSSVKSDATLVRDRPSSITAALGIIEGYARLNTKSKKGHISVSLAMYNGTGSSEMKLMHRHPGSERPVNRKFTSRCVLGHYAVQSGLEPRIVNDLKYFGKQALISPTRSSVGYRSILLYPVQSSKSPERKGFISIDCTKKYAFFGARAEKIVFMCEPLVSHIQDQL